MKDACCENHKHLRAYAEEQRAKKQSAFHRGAAVAFGLMGMAEAIRARFVYQHHCTTCARLDDLCRYCVENA